MTSAMSMPRLTVSTKARKSIARRHPWVFSGAVTDEPVDIEPGATVAVVSEQGELLARGACSPHSQIRVRVWSCDPSETIDERFFYERLRRAIDARQRMPLIRPCTARRLVHSESDGLPGVIVDQYDKFLVCQFLSAGAVYWKPVIVAQLGLLLPVQGIFERSDVEVRAKEGLAPQTGVLWGDTPPEAVEVQLGELRLLVDIVRGHKTGLYLDQRENQCRLADFSRGAEVLNCFSYTGGFGLWALRGGAARVTQIDASSELLGLADRNLKRNGLSAELVAANVFDQLRRYRDGRRSFDVIVLDPPKFVPAMAQMDKGCRGYKDINLLAFKLLRPGGILFTFSCSGLVGPALFSKIVADAALDAGRAARVIGYLHQAADHPVALSFPEGHYLKGLICLVE